jgi:hypothetical protein
MLDSHVVINFYVRRLALNEVKPNINGECWASLRSTPTYARQQKRETQ